MFVADCQSFGTACQSHSNVEQSKNNDSLTPEDGTHRLSRNVGNYQPMLPNIPDMLPQSPVTTKLCCLTSQVCCPQSPVTTKLCYLTSQICCPQSPVTTNPWCLTSQISCPERPVTTNLCCLTSQMRKDLRNIHIRYNVHKDPSRQLSQFRPVHTFASYV